MPAPCDVHPSAPTRSAPFECKGCSAYDLAEVVGYTEWRDFAQAISRTLCACRARGQEPTKHSAEISKIVVLGERADHDRDASAAAKHAGMVTALDVAIFHDHGSIGRWWMAWARRPSTSAKDSKRDNRSSTELAANLFRAPQAEEQLRHEQIATTDGANAAHVQVGQIVRRTIQELGGTLPEQLPTPEASTRPRSARNAGMPSAISSCHSCRSSPTTSAPMTAPTVNRQTGHGEAKDR